MANDADTALRLTESFLARLGEGSVSVFLANPEAQGAKLGEFYQAILKKVMEREVNNSRTD